MRRMNSADLGLAVSMIHGEGWGHTRVDLERILELSPEYSFVWESGGVPKGFVTSVMYERSAAIAHVLVSKESRGRQIGKSLFTSLLDRLEAAGARSIVLYATEDGARLYRKYGFDVAHEMLSVGLHVRTDEMRSIHAACPRVDSRDLQKVAALDERTFGDGRLAMMRRLCEEFPEHCFKVEDGGAISGFVFGRRTPIGYDIGPWICMSGDRGDASDLLATVIGSFPAGGRVDISPFSDHELANEILSGYRHYKKAEKVKLMVRGEPLYTTDRDMVFGACGFDLG